MKKKLNVLYFHGLVGGYSDFIEEVIVGSIDNESKLIYPTLDYDKLYSLNINPIEIYSKLDFVDVVIGNSMGGFIAYQVAKRLNIPCLLFNPALMETTKSYSMFGLGLSEVEDKGNLNYIVIGDEDDVVPTKNSLEWVDRNKIKNLKVVIEKMGHSVPSKKFKNNYKKFISLL